jgi:hypothetical protein
MAALSMRHFDTLDFVKQSKKLGVDEPIAEYQARQIEEAIDIAVDNARVEIESKELATKKDILAVNKEIELIRREIEVVRKEIVQSSNKTIILLGGLFLSSGVIQHFFK